MSRLCIVVLILLTGSTHAQTLTLQVETGESLADGVLSPGEAASFSIRVFGTGTPDEAYRAVDSVSGFSFGELGPGSFSQTALNPVMNNNPAGVGLVYHNDTGRISMLPSGGFWNWNHLGTPFSRDNPMFLFSFDWIPSEYDGRSVTWTAIAATAVIYIGPSDDTFTWHPITVEPVLPASGSFIVAPSPAAASILTLAALRALRRRR